VDSILEHGLMEFFLCRFYFRQYIGC